MPLFFSILIDLGTAELKNHSEPNMQSCCADKCCWLIAVYKIIYFVMAEMFEAFLEMYLDSSYLAV